MTTGHPGTMRAALDAETNPFVHYRHRLDAYRAVTDGHIDDDRFVAMVTSLDEAVAAVDGRGFRVTPVVDGEALAGAIGLGGRLVIKDETGNVSGSHKGRHLFGSAIQLLVDEACGWARAERLTVTSCGNAALAAGVIAAALDRPLEVFVPTWADNGIVTRLQDLGTTVTRCPRRPGEEGDPAYLAFLRSVEDGARPFSTVGSHTPSTLDGGRTLGWELADQVPHADVLYVQVGGGALATSVSRGLPSARLVPVQVEGCAPLRRAWDLLAPDFDLASAAAEPARYMWPWTPEPTSAATGILDDVTYDWVPLVERTLVTGGRPVVATEERILEAHRLAVTHTDIPVDPTGTAGLAGVLTDRPSDDTVVVLFTGRSRAVAN